MKKGLICIGILLTTVLVIFGVYQTTNKNHYDYQGYITDIYENEKGETVIVALSGTKESTFTVKWYSKMYTPVEKIFKNNRVMLSTTFFSDTNIKKATTKIGYFTEGKFVYANGMPFVIIKMKNTNVHYLINVIPSSPDLLDGIETGDTVKFCHSSVIELTAAPTLVAEGVTVIEKGSVASLTDEEIDFIQSLRYDIDGLV